MPATNYTKKYELLAGKSSYFFCPKLGQTVNLEVLGLAQVDAWYKAGFLRENITPIAKLKKKKNATGLVQK